MPITETVLGVAESYPERCAIVGEIPGERLSYRELVLDSRRLFAAIAALHADLGDSAPRPAPETNGIPITAVSIESAFHTARIVASLAGFRAVAAVFDPRWPVSHLTRVILATGAAVVVSESEELADELVARSWTGRVIGIEELQTLEAVAPPAPLPTVRDAEEAFLMLCSSGTTSSPKAFLKTRAQYRANVAVSAAHLDPLPDIGTLAPGPVSYSLTLYAVIECLATGGTVHLADVFDAIDAGRRVGAEQISRVVAVPALVRALADAARRDPQRFAALNLLVTGGANLSEAMRSSVAAALPQARLVNYYGAAEIGFIGDSRDGDGTGIAVYDGVRVSIRDDSGNELPQGEPGTLWVLAEACSDGYVAGTTDEALKGSDGWATVHDVAQLAGNARIELIGRAGDVVVSGGHKVSLPEVERAFEELANLGAVCAVALAHPRLGSVVGLVVEAGETGDAGCAGDSLKRTLREHANRHLAPQFVPGRWFTVAELPRTVGGKIRRIETAEMVQRGEAVRL